MYIDVPYQLPPYAQSRVQAGQMDRLLSDGRKLSLMPLLFGAGQIGISEKPPLHNVGVFADSWDFPRFETALMVFMLWEPDQEPTGWHRHRRSGRYRINGDPDLEYVKCGDGRVEDNVRYAVLTTQGHDHTILSVSEQTDASDTLLLKGMQRFEVESEHCIADNHICHHFQMVYCYGDRYVVLGLNDLIRGKSSTVLRRLTGEHAHG